ncbi:MAG: helix-turn-helix domain-containing protein [Patescibacteria group bacterium]
MANLENEIKRLGLSGKEAKVYLAALELGQASVAGIAIHSGINRATAYVILEELRKKGLVSTFLKGKKTYFAAEPPERLSNLFKIEENKIKDSFLSLEKILPDLDKLYESRGEHPKVRFFEGKEGIALLQEDILKTRAKNIEEIIPLDEAYKNFPPSKTDHRKRMYEKMRKVRFRIIYTSKKGAILPETNIIEKRSIKFIKHELFPISAEIVLFGDKTLIFVTKNKPFAVVLEDQLITSTFRTIFDLLWKNLK